MGPFPKPELTCLSQEVLCQIFSYLPVKDMLAMTMTCKKLTASMKIHLRMCKTLDLCDSEVWGWMPERVTDDQLYSLLSKCPKLEALYGLHPQKVESRRLRKKVALSVLGVVDALLLCGRLKKVETNSFQVLEALLRYLPQVEVIGHFRNEDGGFPPDPTKQLKMNRYPLITSLHLTGVFVPELIHMPELKDLHLQWVRFTRFEPFKSLSVPKLKTFVMKQCFGPDFPLRFSRYLPLFLALSHAPNLERLECIRLPLLGGLFQQAVEASWNIKGFQNVKKLVIADCEAVLDTDIGYLMIAASHSLESVSIPPSVMSDNFFASLQFARCDFSNLKVVQIAYVENLSAAEICPDFGFLYGHASSTITDPHLPLTTSRNPSAITDKGVELMGTLFPNCESLTMSHCPHLINATFWQDVTEENWTNLLHLTLRHCYCLKVTSVRDLVERLHRIEVVVLKDMFPVPPKGCGHVGLSVGTGLGMSSAVVTTRDERVAVNFPQENMAFRIGPEPDLLHFNNMNNGEEHHVHHPVNIKVEPPEWDAIAVDSDDDDELDNAAVQGDIKDNFLLQNYDRIVKQEDASADRSRNIKHEPVDGIPPGGSLGKNGKLKIEDKADTDSINLPSTSRASRKKTKQQLLAGQSYKGPVTRHRKRMMLAKQPAVCSRYSQGTQTCSSFIRQNLGQQICCCSVCNKTCQCCNENNNVRDDAPDRSKAHKKKTKCNKSTCTNDPIYEEDPDQCVSFKSKTLISVTVISCGLSSIAVIKTPELRHIEAQGCPILKRIAFDDTPNLMRINIDHCPKYDFTHFMPRPYLSCKISEPLLVYYKACVPELHMSDIVEKYIAGAGHSFANSGLTFAVLHDYSSKEISEEEFRDSNQAAYRENLLAWLRLVKQVVDNAVEQMGEDTSENAVIKMISRSNELHRIYGEFPDGSQYDLITNNSILAALWRRNKNSLEICPTDESSGFTKVGEVVVSLKDEIAELTEIHYSIKSEYVGFYIDVKN